MQIRPCHEEDLLQVKDILKGSPEAAGWSKDSLQEFFDHYRPYFLVADKQKEIQGFICGRRIADEAEILNLAVRRERRRQAIGHRLVQAFLALLAQDRGGRVHLEVRESNQAAIALYQGTGFRVTARRREYYKDPLEDAVLMSRDVSAITSANQGTP